MRASGLDPIIFPAIAIGALTDDSALVLTFNELATYGLVIFVSPNAIIHSEPYWPRPWPEAVPIAVMGPGSVATLARFGIVDGGQTILSPPLDAADSADSGDLRFDSEALFAQIDLTRLAGRAVLIVKGTGGRPWLAERLGQAGIVVRLLESYRRTLPVLDDPMERVLKDLVAQTRDSHEAAIDCVTVVTSSEGLTNLLVLVRQVAGEGGQRWLLARRLIVPHRRIAENATRLGFHDVVLSGPGDSAILAALK